MIKTDVRLRRQRSGIADFGLFAFRSQDLDEVLNEAARLIAEALDLDLVKIMEHRPALGDMLIRAGVGWAPGVVGHETLHDGKGSPAGFALLCDEPVISTDVHKEDRFEIPPVLQRHDVHSMINVIIAGDGEPFGVLEVDARTRRDFDEDDIDFLRSYANLIAAAVDRLRVHDAMTQSLRTTQELTLELRHRVKNLIALASALASQTKTEGRTAEEYRYAFLGRLRALGRVQNIILEDHAQAVNSLELTRNALEPHLSEVEPSVEIAGDDILIPARHALPLTMILHELGTNAAKYGALSTDGRVRVTWATFPQGDGTLARFSWVESGGPEVAPTRSKGFGTRMIEGAVVSELGGTFSVERAPEGWGWEFVFPIS